jgi:hypothetical protein
LQHGRSLLAALLVLRSAPLAARSPGAAVRNRSRITSDPDALPLRFTGAERDAGIPWIFHVAWSFPDKLPGPGCHLRRGREEGQAAGRLSWW